MSAGGGGSGSGCAGEATELGFHIDFVLAEVGRGTIEDDAAVIDEDDATADGADFLEDVRGEQNGFGFGKFEDEIANALDLVGIEPAGGFVEDEHIGVMEHGMCHADALSEAA
ncbi:MAG: hypothetical protein RL215_644 [Planctomycetota bacterium]